jgi:hypothetical protein
VCFSPAVVWAPRGEPFWSAKASGRLITADKLYLKCKVGEQIISKEVPFTLVDPLYTYIYVPLGEGTYWGELNEQEQKKRNKIMKLLQRRAANYFIKISPLSDCSNRIQNVYLDIEWVNEKCSSLADYFYVKGMDFDDWEKTKRYTAELRSCAGAYAYEWGLDYNRDVEKVIGLYPGGWEEIGWAPFGMDVVFAREFIQQVAHELGHSYGLCEEYSYDEWVRENRVHREQGRLGCGNPWPDTCSKRDEENECFGREGYCCGSTPTFKRAIADCERDFDVMGPVGETDTCGGYDEPGYRTVEKYISCHPTCLLGKGGTCEPGSTEPTKCCRSGRCEPFVFEVNDVERIEYRCQ